MSQGTAEARARWQTYGQWLSARFDNLRVNSVGHLVLPVDSHPPFILGVEATPYGLVADLHCPFLESVPGIPQLLEVVAININLCPFGSVRVVPEDEGGGSYALELRHQVHAELLDQDWLFYYANAMPIISKSLINSLRPAFGGTPLLSR